LSAGTSKTNGKKRKSTRKIVLHRAIYESEHVFLEHSHLGGCHEVFDDFGIEAGLSFELSEPSRIRKRAAIKHKATTVPALCGREKPRRKVSLVRETSYLNG
jgi:hypothetical protein